MVRNCLVCGAEFVASKNRRTCSEQCRKIREAQLEKERRVVQTPRACVVCGKMFIPASVNNITCGPECRKERNRILSLERARKKLMGPPKVVSKCLLCGREFPGEKEYCSYSCRAAHEDGSGHRELYDFGGGKLSTADLMRKWYSEGESASTIAYTLSRSLEEVEEVLNESA